MRASKAAPPPDPHGDLLVHMLGLEDGRGAYRDHYCTDGDEPVLLDMERLGLVRRLPTSKILAEGDVMFVCTRAGRARGFERWEAVRPRPSRSQRVYQAWLRISDVCDVKFGEFLKDPYFADMRRDARG